MTRKEDIIRLRQRLVNLEQYCIDILHDNADLQMENRELKQKICDFINKNGGINAEYAIRVIG